MKCMWAVCFLVWKLQTSGVAGNSALHQLPGVSLGILMYWGQDLSAELSNLNYAGFSGRWLLLIIIFRSRSRYWIVLRLFLLGSGWKKTLRLEWLYWVKPKSAVSIVTSNSSWYHLVGLWTYPCFTSGFRLLDLELSSLIILCFDVFVCWVGDVCLLNFCFRSTSNSWFSHVTLQALC